MSFIRDTLWETERINFILWIILNSSLRMSRHFSRFCSHITSFLIFSHRTRYTVAWRNIASVKVSVIPLHLHDTFTIKTILTKTSSVLWYRMPYSLLNSLHYFRQASQHQKMYKETKKINTVTPSVTVLCMYCEEIKVSFFSISPWLQLKLILGNWKSPCRPRITEVKVLIVVGFFRNEFCGIKTSHVTGAWDIVGEMRYQLKGFPYLETVRFDYYWNPLRTKPTWRVKLFVILF